MTRDRQVGVVERGEEAHAGSFVSWESRRSTYLAITSTSRLTGSPGCLKPSVVRARVSGISETVKLSSAPAVDDGQRDAVDGDRALVDEVAGQLGRQRDLDDLPVLATAPVVRRTRCRRRGPARCGRRAGWPP